MSYVQKTLAADERVLAVGEIHWIAFAGPVLFAVFGVIVLAMSFMSPFLNNLGLVGILLLVVGGAWGLVTFIDKRTTEFALTSKRVIVKRGWIGRKTEEQRLEKIDSIAVDQSVMGRLLQYGTVTVRGSGVSLTPVKGISDALAFRVAAQQAIEGRG